MKKEEAEPIPAGYKKAVSAESFVFLAVAGVLVFLVGRQMGAINMVNTMMNTAFDLLINTCFYIMAIAVLAGAVAALLTEFGVVSLINKLLLPLMRPLYDLPGASVVGILATYMSDNPAILSLADDEGFRCYFKKYQLPALTNLGTSFGMGMIISAFMVGITPSEGGSFIPAVLVGNLGAVLGSIVSVRLMIGFSKKEYGTEAWCESGAREDKVDIAKYRRVRKGTAGGRFIDAMLAGGKSGVSMGFAIIPGVLTICTLVMMLTKGPSESGVYTGAAYEGIAMLPWIGGKLQFLLKPLFGFSSPDAIAVPVTALGAAGAALGLVPTLVSLGEATGNDIAVFTAMCMCWSGYLSTHVAMMDSLKCGQLTGKAILSHTIGGLFAGVAAHWLFVLLC